MVVPVCPLEGPCLTPASLLAQGYMHLRTENTTCGLAVAPGAASVITRQQWSPSWHQSGLGLAGTMALPSAVGWPSYSLACEDKISAGDL